MKYIELPEKLNIFMNLILDNKILVLMIMALLLLTFLVINKNISKIKYLIYITFTFIIGLVITIITNSDSLLATFDNIINKVFLNIYFPSVEVYLLILLFSIILTINSIVSKKIKNSYKVINIIMFFTLFFLLISFLLTIANKGIDIFDINSLYTDESCIVLLQLSTQVFVLWLIITLIIYVINAIIDRIDEQKEQLPIVPFNQDILSINDDVVESSVEELKDIIIQQDEEIIELDDLYIDNAPLEEDLVIENPIFAEKTKDIVKFNLDDYKVFSRILKDAIILNSYKDKITKKDLLDINALTGIYSKEEFELYTKMLNMYIN